MLSGSVTGLLGTGLVLQINGGETLAVSASGAFTFPTSIDSGASYAVTVSTQPSGPSQNCTVNGGTGTVGGANVTSIAINCATNKFTVGGTTSGLLGSGLVLQNNGGDDQPITANGTFAFATALDDLSSYAVTIQSQPTSPHQTCTLANDTGALAGGNVTTVALTCTTNTYKISATVTGLVGSGLVLKNNAGDDLPVSANNVVSFVTPVVSGQPYEVTVSAQPTGPSQTCAVTNGTGTVAGSDITNVAITCTTNQYTVGGTVSGLSGTGLVLQNSGGDDFTVSANGPFAFGTPISSGQTYAVTVMTQPSGPVQVCSVTNGNGTITASPVTDVTVSCVTQFCQSNGAGGTYCYQAGDSIQTRALKACESHFGVGTCCIIGGGYNSQQYGRCDLGGGPGSVHFHYDNHPNGHCGPIYVVGDVVAPGWCGAITGSFLTP